jgi:SAM-dependent methyltransferase
MEVERDRGTTAFARYLTAKRAVDDRSLNQHVLSVLRAQVPLGDPNRPVRVLELGAGNGTMVARSLEWRLFRHAEYVAVDGDADVVADGWRSLPAWARARGLSCTEQGTGAARALHIAGEGGAFAVRLVHADLLDFDPGQRRFDLLIANAVLDMVDVATALPRIWRHAAQRAHFWFTINFDGETIFAPEIDPDLERRIVALYHRSMDERVVDGRPSGDSRCGRHLFGHLTASGADILAAGASDWVVHPVAGRYPGDEAAFLHPIIDWIEGALRDHPELDGEELKRWVEARRRQIDEARLTYIAHQLDFFGRAPASREEA